MTTDFRQVLWRLATRSVTRMERVTGFPGGDRAADVLLWLAITAPVLISDDEPSPGGLPLLWMRIAAVPLLGLAVHLARRQPLAAAAVPAALGLAVTPEMAVGNLVVALAALAYLLGLRSAGRRSALLFFVAVFAAGVLLSVVAPGASVTVTALNLAASVLLLLVLPWLVGLYMRRAELLRAGWQLAERLEQEQRMVSDRARLRERSRIASDMHDTFGHELSMIALRAAALQVAPDVGPEGRKAAGELRQAAAVATQRLREVVGVLREEGESVPLRPAADTVASLVWRAAPGLRVTLDDRLRPAGGEAAELPPMTERAIFRVVQEALTNATKHAPGAPVAVTLSRDGAEAEVTVVNQAPPAQPPPGPSGPPGPRGYGLVSLDERVRQAGGTLRARPTGDGFTVTARLPLTAGAPATPPGDTGTARREPAVASGTARRNMISTVWLPAAAAAVLLLLMFAYDRYAG
jgi:signal transduction histidine kinase